MALLELESVSKHFGELWALKEIDFSLNEGEIVGLVGPNGAGKTTLFNVITGRHRPSSGKIHFRDKDITFCQPHEIQRLGISRTFQSSRPFGKMSALENVLVGRIFGGEFHLFARSTDIETARQLLELVGLSHKERTSAVDLTLSEQRRLDLARALASQPKLLLLDELAAGLATGELDELMNIIRKINRDGVTIVIVEHIMKVIMGLCERITVIQYGSKIAEGSPESVANDPLVTEAYLGEDYML